MRILCLLIGCLLLHYPQPQNDLSRQKLKGWVRTVTMCQCPVKKDGVTDSNGWIVYMFRYDNNGNQVEDNDYIGGTLYNGFGMLLHKRIYRYDAGGKQVEVIEYKQNGNINQKVNYSYDERGNRVERHNYNADGTLWYRSVFRYDDAGNKLACDKYNTDTFLQEHYGYSYDSRGNLAEEEYHVYNLPYSNKPGAEKSGDKRHYADIEGKLDYRKTYTYDDSGKKIGELYYVPGFAIPFQTKYLYENYDTAGNWLKETYMEDGKPATVIERVIEYYQ